MEEEGCNLVTAATGALGPVLQKLNSLLDGDGSREHYYVEESRSDMEFIRDELEPMRSLLARIWGRELDNRETKSWMNKVRKLSYHMEDAIDSFVLSVEEEQHQRRSLLSLSKPLRWTANDGFIRQQTQFIYYEAVDSFNVLKRKVETLSGCCPCPWLETLQALAAVTGTLGLVLTKVTASLGYETDDETTARSELEFIKSELQRVHSLLLLPKIWSRYDVLDPEFHMWMLRAKELCDVLKMNIAMDDFSFEEFKMIAKYMSSSCDEMISKFSRRSPTMDDPRSGFFHKDASELVGMGEQKDELIRLVFAGGDEGASVQQFSMVCIVGFAGMGKTTLADLVYNAVGDQFECQAFVSVSLNPDVLQVLSTILRQVSNNDHVQFQRQVSDCERVRSQGAEPTTEQYLTASISNFLADKRYLIIVDDIWHWEEWEIIRKALPKNNLGCKIIMTTRVNSIAEKCETEEGAHVYTQKYGDVDARRLEKIVHKFVRGCILEANTKELSAKIVQTSGLMPLAIICLSSAWAESHGQGDHGECWDTWVSEVLMNSFLSTPSLKPLVQSLSLGFDDLPVHQRTCLLYCSIYPQNYLIERDLLVRKWIAEGFVSQEEVAEACFDKLVSSNLLQPRGLFPTMYTVHPMMLGFLVCKAKEDNFVSCKHYNGLYWHVEKISRRISLYTDHYPNDERGYAARSRSLIILGRQIQLDGVPFDKFKSLRVLEITDSKGLENGHLVDICELIWLRYLGLKEAPITELPREVGKLKNLETLSVRRTRISKLPQEIEELQHLETLNISGTQVTTLPKEMIEKLHHLTSLNISATEVTELPREITKLEHLRDLNISCTGVRELPKELGKLQHLRTLDIRGSKVRELSWELTTNPSLSVVVGDMRSAQVAKLPLLGAMPSGDEEVIISPSGATCWDESDLSIHVHVLINHFGSSCQVLPVPMHRVAGRHMSVPQWVKQGLMNNNSVSALDIRLCKLGEDDLDFLKQMPNLKALALRFEALPQEPIAITSGGFSELESFYVDSRLPRVTFQPGAMPKLKHLEFKFYTGAAAGQHYSMGITHLPSLEKVVFRCSEHYTSDSPGISAAIQAVRKEAMEHLKEITLYVNGMRPEVFGSGATWMSQAEKDIAEKEFEERERIREKRELLLRAAERRRYNKRFM